MPRGFEGFWEVIMVHGRVNGFLKVTTASEWVYQLLGGVNCFKKVPMASDGFNRIQEDSVAPEKLQWLSIGVAGFLQVFVANFNTYLPTQSGMVVGTVPKAAVTIGEYRDQHKFSHAGIQVPSLGFSRFNTIIRLFS